MHFKEETEKLNKILIQTIGQWLGVRFPVQGSARCPFDDHEDINPSFEIRKPGTRWICYGCGRRGGSIDFVKTFNRMSFIEAKRWLAERSGSTFARMSRPKPSSVSNAAACSAIESQLDVPSKVPPDYEVYESLMSLSPLLDHGREYLASRGLRKKIIDNFKIGQLTNKRVVLRELLASYGFERTYTAGVLTKDSTPASPKLLFVDGCLMFPFFEGGQVAYIQGRAIGLVDPRMKWRNLHSIARKIYNIDVLLAHSGRPVAICEGVIDALSASELGYDAIGILGVSAGLSVEHVMQLKGRDVNILLDWDKAGDLKAFELQNKLHRFGVSSTRKQRPSGTIKDVNEYLVQLRGRR